MAYAVWRLSGFCPVPVQRLSGTPPEHVIRNSAHWVVRMDPKFQNILDCVPQKPGRSRLAPYGELIDALRQRGLTFREVAAVLIEKCHLQVSKSAINDFVRMRSRARIGTKLQPSTTPAIQLATSVPKAQEAKSRSEGDNVDQRIVALATCSTSAEGTYQQFDYDPNEPLLLPKKG